MPNIIDLRLLENKNIIAELNGIPLAQENSYKIIAGEENATQFKIKSKPTQYANAQYTVEMVNSQGYGIKADDIGLVEKNPNEYIIEDDTFILPTGMAVAGYGWVQIRAYQGEEKVPFMTLKVKVWNTLPNWKEHIAELIDPTDPTLTEEGKAADAKAVGNALKILRDEDDRLEYKIDGKVTATPYNYVDTRILGGAYIVDANNSQTKKPLSTEAIPNSIPFRDEQGKFCVSQVIFYDPNERISATYSASSIVHKDGVEGTATELLIPKNKFGTIATEEDFNLLKQLALEKGDLIISEITQSYTERTTANGENIVDGQRSTLKKVQGNTVRTKNLFKIDKLNDHVTYENDVLTISRALFILYTSEPQNAIPIGTTVTITAIFEGGQVDGSIIFGGYHDSVDGTSWQGSVSAPPNEDLAGKVVSNTFTTTNTVTDFVILANGTATIVEPVRVKLQYEIGDTATPYTPYFEGLKNASFQGIKSVGRNQFDISKLPIDSKLTHTENSITLSALNYQKGNFSKFFPYAQVGKTYTFISNLQYSDDATTATNTGQIRVYSDDSTFLHYLRSEKAKGYNKRTITITEDTLKGSLIFYGINANNPVTWENVMLVEGDYTNTDLPEWMPFVEEDLLLPEAVDCGLGTTIDFENRQIEETYAEYTFTGNETWVADSTNETVKLYYLNHMYIPKGTAYIGFCDRFPVFRGSWSGYLKTPYHLRFGQEGSVIFFTVPADSTETPASLMTGATIRYPILKPKITPFTSEQAAVGNTVKSYKNGVESVQGNDNSTWVENTLTQEYFEIGGVENE